MINFRHKQKGASFLSILVVLIVAGVFFSVAFKLYPAYMDYMTVDSVLTGVVQDKAELEKGHLGIQRDLKKKWRVNQIKLPKEAITVRRKEGVIKITLDYEVRVPMFFNVDAMVKFKKQYEAIAP